MSKRAQLLENEAIVRALWRDSHTYESHVPSDISREKYFCTFPYPYMNGRMHIGHAFSALKAEFQARFQRSQGKNVLWPFGLHCTGIPIVACADKIRLELRGLNDQDGNPEEAKPEEASDGRTHEDPNLKSNDYTKFSSKKTKLSAKSNSKMSQVEMMKHMGIDENDIPKFGDPQYWITYFSPLAINDMKMLGMSIDWRRSFITTDRNPYYDAFVKWQFDRLKKLDKLIYGCRPSILSRLLMQPCADHDRSEGEGASTQEYTIIKMKLDVSTYSLMDSLHEPYCNYKDILAEKDVYLLAATLTPETMYGQTNCFVLPTGDYEACLGFSKPKLSFNSVGVVENLMDVDEAVKCSNSIYITTSRAAYNMAYQGVVILRPVSHGSLHKLHSISSLKGIDLIGASVDTPLSIHSTVYVLPMLTISLEKGTGIVACVPGESPDDYSTIFEMRKKGNYFKEMYNVDPIHYSLGPVPVVSIPDLGTCSAVRLCQEEKIVSNKDTAKLEKCKNILYKRGFYEGVMVIGPYRNLKVFEVRDKVKEEMMRKETAFTYFEPTSRVISRSGDVCVVALCNQWYTKFGDSEWKQLVMNHVSNPEKFTCYSESVMNQVKHVIQWLDNWACSRSYGLGTVLPWEDISKEKNSLIESLSDSTIYMAYYTIAHHLQGDIFGTKPGSMGIQPHELTNETFDYIFHITDDLPQKALEDTKGDFKSKLKALREEFAYWYPVDLRTSGKDLIFNHLTMSLFIHKAIWQHVLDMETMPKSYFCVGHILVDSEKMSKSKGNFLTVEDSIKLYTADGTRVALADAGDGLDDANFSKDTAEGAILKLYTTLQAAQADVIPADSKTAEKTWLGCFAKRVFENEIKVLAEKAKLAYEKFVYREALKCCFYDFTTIRRNYIQMAKKDLDRDSLILYHETFCKISNPIIPHMCEFIWVHILKKESTLSQELWPNFTEIDYNLHRQVKLLYRNLEDFRKCKDRSMALAKKKNSKVAEYTGAAIYVAREYPELHQEVLKLLQSMNIEKGMKVTEKDLVEKISESELVKGAKIADRKTILAFASYQIKEVATLGPSALLLQLPYSELDFLNSISSFISQSIGVTELHILPHCERYENDNTSVRFSAFPGKPSILFY